MLGLLGGLLAGFVIGILVCRKNKQGVESALAAAEAELAKLRGKQ